MKRYTSSLGTYLRARDLAPAAARQALSRLPEGVRVLQGLPSPKRAQFLFLEKQFGTEEYWRALVASAHEASPAYSTAIVAVRARGGIVPSRHFDIICGSPIKQKRQLSAAKIAERPNLS
jgi:hypothetical protein